jgi:hypothetical protein
VPDSSPMPKASSELKTTSFTGTIGPELK